MQKNMYMPDLAKVVAIREETAHTRSLLLALEKEKPVVFEPGQFIELTLFGQGEFPVSVADVIAGSPQRFLVTIQEMGKVTRAVGQLREGAQVGMRGPFGRGFPLKAFAGRDVNIISGGVGLAAVWLLIKQLLKTRETYGRLNLLHGARTPADMIYREELRAMAAQGQIEVSLTVDRNGSGWAGRVGLVTELVRDARLNPDKSVAVICGPGVMMQAAVAELEKQGVPRNRVYLSLERRMQCGMGVCGHCMIGSKRVCLDGPVFPLSELGDLEESGL
ncbi:MAG: FAD/NAD(P)-binding protein [Desulfobaccales bacterium]